MGLVRILADQGKHHPDFRIVEALGIMLLKVGNGFLPFSLQHKYGGQQVMDSDVADSRIPVLRKQNQSFLKKLSGSCEQRIVPLHASEDHVYQSPVIDDFKGVRETLQRLLRFGKSLRVFILQIYRKTLHSRL